ncbi:MAG: helix-hairpin-helix domain-containing protein, partial [Pseudomonadota bacterium]
MILLFAFTGTVYAAVNINTASQTELESLQGIGPAKAKAIIEYREKNG